MDNRFQELSSLDFIFRRRFLIKPLQKKDAVAIGAKKIKPEHYDKTYKCN